MNTLKTYWKILTLSTETYSTIKESQGGFWYALRLFLVVSLIASLGMLAGLRQIPEQQTVVESITQFNDTVQAFTTRLPGVLTQWLDAFKSSMSQLTASLQATQPPLGADLSAAIRQVGGWLAAPFDRLAIWLAADIALFLFAVLLGGQAKMRQHMSLLLLAIAPQVLTVVASFSLNGIAGWIGRLLLAIGLIWSLVIVIKALAVAHSITNERALGIAALTFVVAAIIIPLLGFLFTSIVLAILL